MALEETKKHNVQIDEEKKRKYLIKIVGAFLKVSVAIMEYYKAVAPDRKSKLVCTKSIKNAEEAIVHLNTIKHIEILDYLYSVFIGNNAIAYSISGQMVLSPKIKEWDTDEGVKELITLMEENKKKKQEKFEQQEKNRKAVEEAKKQGKKVEMVYDKETKSVRPLIVEETPKA